MKLPRSGEEGLASVHIRRWCVLVVLCIASACWAQTAKARGASSRRPQAAAKTKAAHPVAPAIARRPAATDSQQPSPPQTTNTAAQPAKVSLKGGQLTVEANNSELRQILRQVASISGMTIDGLDKSTRVFGAYGPGNPRDILSNLLAGSGYNFMMVGDTADGAPRKLLLTAKNNDVPAPNPAIPAATAPSNRRRVDPTQQSESSVDEPDAEPSQESESSAEEPDATPLGPGAVDHPPPAPVEDPQQRMQQNLQRLQEMHRTQQQNAPQ